MRASGNGVIVVDVTAVRVAIIPVFKPHAGGWWAGVGIVATAATVAAATAAATVVVSDGVGIFAADVVICATTGIVGAPPPQYPCICCWPQHPRVQHSWPCCCCGGYWIVRGGGLVADGIAEHLDLSLHAVDDGIVVAEGFLRGGICHTKVRDGVG